MFILAMTSSPSRASAISSSIGAIDLQGAHHSAQKSTNTGLSDSRTCLAKFLSDTWITLIAYSFSLVFVLAHGC